MFHVYNNDLMVDIQVFLQLRCQFEVGVSVRLASVDNVICGLVLQLL